MFFFDAASEFELVVELLISHNFSCFADSALILILSPVRRRGVWEGERDVQGWGGRGVMQSEKEKDDLAQD